LLFAAIAAFLALTLWAFTRHRRGWTPGPDGSPWRLVALVLSISMLLLFLSLVPEQHSATSLGTLLVAAGLVGSALFAIGAAVWTGVTAHRLRAVGWVLAAIAFGIPSTLSLVLPLVGLLAFPLTPISHTASERTHTRSAPA
jgi:hypothetical protein